ncbi:MAG: glycogen debranching enzyme family protein [Clostridia bacterium]|nr:glycogen debranching enzyme family protein [Clostridia bacterium]
MNFTKENLRDVNFGINREWMLTNGIGGFAGGTILGSNSRRYHGLLIAALNPPASRHLVVSGLHEVVKTEEKEECLACFESGESYFAEGFRYISGFHNNILPTWTYQTETLNLTKQIWMVYGKNTTVIRYKIRNGAKKSKLLLYPLVNFRDYHSERHDFSPFRVSYEKKIVEIRFDEGLKETLKMYADKADFYQGNDVFYNMSYRKERERGLNHIENQFMPGYFEVNLKPGEEKEIHIVFTIEDTVKFNLAESYENAISRPGELIRKAGYQDKFINELVKAADAFIVHRNSTDGKTIIAGYPWFTDWGRDTLIALPGLTLATKRYDDAKSILKTFAKYIKGGLLPNVFPDFGETPGYNTVDASLWFFEAVYRYVETTKDEAFLKEIFPKLEEIYQRYRRTKEEIAGLNTEVVYSDDDALIYAGNEHTQLTWMDAKVGDFVVTPRFGKAVEINALWYNAIMIMAEFAKRLRKKEEYSVLAKKVKKSFEKTFWNKKEENLYDVVNENGADGSVRPNQIFAISLTFPVIEGEKAEKIFFNVAESLYTPVGLRSLAPSDKNYKGIYIGDIWSRDTAYHQGTVWTWPLGYFITASKKLQIKDKRYTVETIVKNIQYTLTEETLGQISEIFDGDKPYTPRGCYAQAWSVGEVLRAITE